MLGWKIWQSKRKITSEEMPPKKQTKKKTSTKRSVSGTSTGTQVENPSLFGLKDALETVSKINLQSFPDQELDKVHDFCEKLKEIICEEQIILLKKKLFKAELQADLVIKFAIEYLHRYQLHGFALFMQRVSEQMNTFAYEISLEQNADKLHFTSPSHWMDLNEAFENVFKVEKDTVEVFGKLYPLLQKDSDNKLITMKIGIIEQFEELMELFQSAKKSQDILDIDKKLLKSQK